VAGRSLPNLAPGATYASRLMWNTSGFSPGTYTVLVAVPPVPGELNLLDNSREAGQMILTQSPSSGPSPSPAASGSAQGLNYGRQLAIVAAIAEAAIDRKSTRLNSSHVAISYAVFCLKKKKKKKKKNIKTK